MLSSYRASAPGRVDLAGGTLDIWPLFLLHPGSITVNVAVGLRAHARVRPRERGVVLAIPERGLRCESADAASADGPGLELLAALVRWLAPHTPLELETRSEIPVGSGLGGSSALAVAVAAALQAAHGRPIDPERLIDLSQDVETSVLGVPTGRQDYLAALYGGLSCLRWQPGGVLREPLPLGELAPHLVLVDTAQEHFSGANNWHVTRARLDGEQRVARQLEAVRAASAELAGALASRQPERAGRALGLEWEARKRLAPGVSTPQLDRLVTVALETGAWGAKVCGAGGGGCLVALTPSERRQPVLEALARAEARPLDVAPEAQGLVLKPA